MNNYYKLLDVQSDGATGTFRVSLCPDCEVYKGHFPGNPVCPGVCNIQMIQECAERLAGCRLHVSSIHRCRLMAVLTPASCTELLVEVLLQPVDNGYAITATIRDEKRVYVNYKGEMRK